MRRHQSRRFTVLAVLACALLPGVTPLAGQTQGPIHFVFDTHCDPFPNNAAPLSVKLSAYNQWIANLNWELDQCDIFGAKLSFLSTGWWTELVAQGGATGPGAVVLQRIYNHGGQIGTHQHSEYKAGANNWPNLLPNASLAQISSSWNDHIQSVNAAITTAWNGAPPEALTVINGVRGSHVPGNEPDFHTLMTAFNMQIRQPGPEEDYFGWYGHHIWNPFRPSSTNSMQEDLSAPFVQITQGSTIGIAGIHHGVYQDMTLAAARRQFLQLYINWRYQDRMGLPARVWCWGTGSHPTDFDTTDPSPAALVGMLSWLNVHFTNRIEPTGSDTLLYSTHRETAAHYFAWEAAHPGMESFGGHALAVNWAEYPYLRAVAEELNGFAWTADLTPAPGVEAYQLSKGGNDAVILWRDAGTSVLDLSALVGPFVRVVGLETGLLYGTDASAVSVAQEPIIVTEELSRVTVAGSATLGSTLTLGLAGPAGAHGTLWIGLAPAALNVPHLGTLMLDPAAPLALLLDGTIPATGLSWPIAIPANPALLGLTAWFQGAVFSFSEASAKLSINAPQIVIQ